MKLKPPWELPRWRETKPLYIIALLALALNLTGLILVAMLWARARS